ncbi:MAG: toprim domain-containing protein [Pseudomonadota bacterium]
MPRRRSRPPCAWFQSQLRLPVGRGAFDYLRDRGVDEAALAGFRLGFAPDQRTALKSHLLKQGFAEDVLLEGGLLVKPEDGGASYDRFRGRVMFPIADRRGRVIAFGGRVMGDGQPKYLNSPEGPLFHKGRTLYAHHLAREAAAHHEPVIVAEGYMDVVALHRAGFRGAVAPLGTALTEDQLARAVAARVRAGAVFSTATLPASAPLRARRCGRCRCWRRASRCASSPCRAARIPTTWCASRAAACSFASCWPARRRSPRSCGRPRSPVSHSIRPSAGPICECGCADHINHIGDRDVRRFYAEDFKAREARLFDIGGQPADDAAARRPGVARRAPGRAL